MNNEEEKFREASSFRTRPFRYNLKWLQFAAAVIWGLLKLPAPAQSTGTGSVSGVVTDLGAGTALSNVQIAVEGGSRLAISGDNGSYLIGGLPIGKATLRATYIGAAEVVSEIVKASDKTTKLNIQLNVTNVHARGLNGEILILA